EDIDALQRLERDVFQAEARATERKVVNLLPEVMLRDVLIAFKDVLQRAEMYQHHQVQREPLSVRQRMSDVLANLKSDAFSDFTRLFDPREGRIGVVVTFLALLELLKERLIELVQAEPFAPIHVKAMATAVNLLPEEL